MADLNKELNEYLLNNKTEKQHKLPALPTITVLKPSLEKWFKKSSEPKSEESRWTESAQSCFPTLTRLQRLTGFVLCILMGILCFCLSAIYVPVLLLKARKFGLLYSLGSLFILLSFTFLWGPLNYFKSLFTPERRCFTISYLLTLGGTLYCALHLQSTPLTIFCGVLQIITLLYFLVSHIPGGTTGLMYFGKLFKSPVSSTLPI
ncbi:vesicle transport protein SFT2C [Chelonus insularis]|uniref:vesicle transport protein SFT2C n=1 Tax=Chelonus insularis TaxID=460826 RepID=UPI00158895B6|nr:vesicle transport protein SFT2C [Chelonus insularis]